MQDRIPHQPLPEPVAQLHSPRDPRARAPRHRDPPVRAARRPEAARRCCRHRASRSGPSTSCFGVAGGCSRQRLRQRCIPRGPVSRRCGWPRGWPAAPIAGWPCIWSTSLEAAYVAQRCRRDGHRASARALSAPTRPRSRCLLPRSAALPSASPSTARRSSTGRASSRSARRCAARRSPSRSARSAAASSAAGSDTTRLGADPRRPLRHRARALRGRGERLRPADAGLVSIGRLVEQKGQLLLARGAIAMRWRRRPSLHLTLRRRRDDAGRDRGDASAHAASSRT